MLTAESGQWLAFREWATAIVYPRYEGTHGLPSPQAFESSSGQPQRYIEDDHRHSRPMMTEMGRASAVHLQQVVFALLEKRARLVVL